MPLRCVCGYVCVGVPAGTTGGVLTEDVDGSTSQSIRKAGHGRPVRPLPHSSNAESKSARSFSTLEFHFSARDWILPLEVALPAGPGEDKGGSSLRFLQV